MVCPNYDFIEKLGIFQNIEIIVNHYFNHKVLKKNDEVRYSHNIIQCFKFHKKKLLLNIRHFSD